MKLNSSDIFTLHFFVYLLGSATCLVFMIYNFFSQPLYPFGTADGEKYFIVALNPLVKHPTVDLIRYLRILFPLLVFFLSELTLQFSYLLQSHLDRHLITMLWIWILNICFYLWTCKTSLKLFQNNNSTFNSFGLLALNPILLISVISGLTDPAFYAFTFNLLYSIKEERNWVFPYSVFAVFARFDYSFFILPFLVYETYRRKSLKFFILIILMLITTVFIFVFFTYIFEISVIYIILNLGTSTFYITPFIGWIMGLRNTNFFSSVFVIALFCIIILFFVIFSLDLRYNRPVCDLDVFSLCFIFPLLFAWTPLTISYTSALGRMLSVCPSVFRLHHKIETYTGFIWFSKNDRIFIIIFYTISFIMVFGYFI